MKNLQNQEKVLEIFSKISGKKITHFNLDGDIKDELTLDSIQIVELFILLEQEFEIELPLKLMTVKSGREFMEKIEFEVIKKEVYSSKDQ